MQFFEVCPVIKSVAKFASSAILSLAAMMAAPTASAAIVTGNWDPTLSSLNAGQFNGLGWTTRINVSVDDSCVADDGSSPIILNRTVRIFGIRFTCRNPVPLLNLAGSPFSILSAELGFYGLDDGILRRVFTLNPTSFTPEILLLGEGSEILFLRSSTNSNVVSYRDYDFQLSLPGLAPQLLYRGGTTTSFTAATDPITATQFNLSNGNAATVVNDTRLIEGQLVFSFVPEPGSTALVLLALLAAGAAGSRRPRRGLHAGDVHVG